MKVILSQDVFNLGQMGDTVDVKSGYARNYLLPRKMAVIAESASAKQIAHEMGIIKRREQKMQAELVGVKAELEKITVEIKARAGENEKLFGSVTNSNIAEALHEMGHEFDRRRLELKEPIKALGVYTVPLKLGAGVEAEIKVWVSAEEPPETESILEEELEDDIVRAGDEEDEDED